MRLQDYVEGWVRGWAHSRLTPAPVEIEGGWAIETGTTRESRRYVLHTPTAEQVESIVERSQPPGACIKYAGTPAFGSLFSTEWVRTEPAWFMLREITEATAVPVPDGYDVRTVQLSDTLLTTEIRTTTGELAARGQIGLGQVFVVPDQIVTEDAHRRRGLGSIVMNYLEQSALRAGRSRAVLGATSDGRALYTKLGWTTAAEIDGPLPPSRVAKATTADLSTPEYPAYPLHRHVIASSQRATSCLTTCRLHPNYDSDRDMLRTIISAFPSPVHCPKPAQP